MNLDERLSTALHVLLHLSGRDGPMTSAELAKCVGTNPVVVRRTMAGLRDAGVVGATKGHNGGWSLTADPETISLRDVHIALGAPATFAVGLRNQGHGCLVEQAVNGVLENALLQADAMLVEQLSRVTLAALSNRVRLLADTRQHHHDASHHHKS